MNFVCEDLPLHRVTLVPVSSKDYETHLSDIERRVSDAVEGSPPYPQSLPPRIIPEDRPTSAILLNRNSKAIVGLNVVWRYETESGQSFHHSRGMLSPNRLLLPFGSPNDSNLKIHAYWNTIFPGSKRYVAESGMVGDNTDVRSPADDEKWRGGMSASGGNGRARSRELVRQVTLILDGVFFLDGEFVGPDAGKMFEQTVAEAEAHRFVAKIAKGGHDRRLTPAEILVEIEKTTGTAPDHMPMPANFRNPNATKDDFLEAALQNISYQLAMRRRFPQAGSDEQTVFNIMRWDDVDLPRFRKG